MDGVRIGETTGGIGGHGVESLRLRCDDGREKGSTRGMQIGQ